MRLSEDERRGEIERERKEKDDHFRHAVDSPIPSQAREAFAGLNYYPVDAKYRLAVQLKEYPSPETIFMGTTRGGRQEYVRVGFFEFPLDGRLHRLQIYKSGPSNPFPSESFFISFRDRTSGVETYGAGRYLEIPVSRSGAYELDFNKAHNPLCAYSDNFSCPIAPKENWLDVEIRAGEKVYRQH